MTKRILVGIIILLAGVMLVEAETGLGWLPAGTEIVSLRTANARHYSNGDGTVRAVLEARGDPALDAVGLNASMTGYSELLYQDGSIIQPQKHVGGYHYCGYYGDYYLYGLWIQERCYAQWDIGTIPDSSTVNSMRCSTYCNGINGTVDSLRLFHMRLQPSLVNSAEQLYIDAGDGYVYGYYPVQTGWRDAALSNWAVSTLQRHLNKKDTNWFAVGYSAYPERAGTSTWEMEFNGSNQSNPPRLIVDYTPPSIPHDVGVVKILRPNGLIDSFPSMTPVCTVANFGTNIETYWVRLTIGSFWRDSAQVINDSVGKRRGVSFGAPPTGFPRGTHAVTCSTMLGADGNRSNDKFTTTISVRVRDVRPKLILAPTGTVDSGMTVTPACSVYNAGTTAESYNVWMRIGGYSGLSSVANQSPGTAAYLTFPAWTATALGRFGVVCSTDLNDMANVNNRLVDSITVRRPPQHDVGCTRLLAPNGLLDSGATATPACSVYNYGAFTESYSVRMKIGTAYDNTVAVSGHAADSYIYVTFPTWTALNRAGYAVSCSTMLTGDALATNDKAAGSVTVAVHDVGAVAIVAPTGTFDPASVTPQASVHNYGTAREPVRVFYTINPGATYIDSVVLPAGLPVGADTLLEFSRWFASAGIYEARCSTVLATDQVPLNDTVSGNFTVRQLGFVDVAVTAILAPVGTLDTNAMAAPRAEFRNYGELPATFRAWFWITDSTATRVYADSILVEDLVSDSAAAKYFTVWPPNHAPGDYATRCSVGIERDTILANDTLNGAFTVRTAPATPGWYQKTDIPLGAKSKRVRDGGALAADGQSHVYAFKGNGRCEFYRYDQTDNAWATLDSIPILGSAGKKKAVKKGAAMCYAADKVYAVKGNNCYEFWSFDPLAPVNRWQERASVPMGARAIKEGAGLTTVSRGDSTYIYFLKGSGTFEFYRHDVLGNSWAMMTSAPAGVSGKFFKNGSCLAYDGDTLIYALKATYNEYFSYSIPSNTWTQKTGLPFVGSTGRKKKVKDGSGIAALNGMYALKGGNTFEFWKYLADSDRWYEQLSVPLGGGKRVKGGGALTSDGEVLWALKGNNTYEFYKYVPYPTVPATDGGPQVQEGFKPQASSFKLSMFPNPLAEHGFVTFALPRAGDVRLELYDVTGKLVTRLASGRWAAGEHSVALTRTPARGVYLLKLVLDGSALTRKVVVE